MGPVDRTRTVLIDAVELAKKLGDGDAELRGLGALIAMQFVNGDSYAARETARRFLSISHRSGDLAATQIGERLLGNALQLEGKLSEAQTCLERVCKIPDLSINQRGTLLFRYDQQALGNAMLARVRCLQGFMTEAVAQAEASSWMAQQASDQFSFCWVIHYAVFPVSLMTGDIAAAERAVTMLTDSEKGLPTALWKILGRFMQGKLMIARGAFSQGVSLLRSALAASDRSGWQTSFPEFLGSLAEGLAGLGNVPEAIAVVERALDSANRGERWCVAELLRIKGELLLQRTGDQPGVSAEICFGEALALARQQDALFWELRAAISFARFRAAQDRPSDARQILAPVYERFTDGFETPDLRAAKEILDALPAS